MEACRREESAARAKGNGNGKRVELRQWMRRVIVGESKVREECEPRARVPIPLLFFAKSLRPPLVPRNFGMRAARGAEASSRRRSGSNS